MRSAIELSKHASSALRILKLASMEEQSNYVSTWSKIVSVCAQELKHGAFIWKQSLQKNLHNQILSEPQGNDKDVLLMPSILYTSLFKFYPYYAFWKIQAGNISMPLAKFLEWLKFLEPLPNFTSYGFC